MKTAKKLPLDQYSETDQARILEAQQYAQRAHKGQLRRSGEPFFTHPFAVASYLVELKMDADTVAAGFLHDVVEDTGTTPDDIQERFGPVVWRLVDGVTKIGQIDYAPAEDTSDKRRQISAENIRKLLLAMSKDIRVVIVKLADRRHNLQTLKYMSKDDRLRIARESLEIFAPLADRLGMGALKAELEDMAFMHVDPRAYSQVRKLAASQIAESADYLDELQQTIQVQLKQEGVVPQSIHARQKHLYSIYRKLAKAEGDIGKMYDINALRIIVPDVSACYQVLGILHKHYKPLIYRIKDYIAVPKPNGYQSLHTTVFAPEGRIIEMQIRTPQMHQEAEFGLAAHALYNQHKDSAQYQEGKGMAGRPKLSWVGELGALTAQAQAGNQLIEDLRIDFFQDRIFVFSPHGDLYDLPEGATPVDFAFAIHSDVGLRTQGARINGRIAPLDRPLENRDVVEILTRKQAAPNRQWLAFVKTAAARSRIKAWFRAAGREHTVAVGRAALDGNLKTWGQKFDDLDKQVVARAAEHLNVKDAESLLAAVGEGMISVTQALRRLVPASMPAAAPPKPATTNPHSRAMVAGAPELECSLASCCKPAPPAHIVGYITRGSGVTVHVEGCANIPSEPNRLLDCGWEQAGGGGPVLTAHLHLICRNGIGLVRDITDVIARSRINIVKITTLNIDSAATKSTVDVDVEVLDFYELSRLVTSLERLASVETVRRAVQSSSVTKTSEHKK